MEAAEVAKTLAAAKDVQTVLGVVIGCLLAALAFAVTLYLKTQGKYEASLTAQIQNGRERNAVDTLTAQVLNRALANTPPAVQP